MKFSLKSLKIGTIVTDAAGLAGGGFAADKVRPYVGKMLPKLNPAYTDVVIALGAQVAKSMLGSKGIIAAVFDGMTANAGSAAIAGFSGPAVSGVGNYGYEQLPNYDPGFSGVNGLLNNEGVGYIPGQDGVGYVGDETFAKVMM